MLSTSVFIALCVTLVLVNTAGVLLVALQLPGTWLMLAATAVFAWIYWDHGSDPVVGWWTLAGLLGLAALGEVLETALAGVASRRAGGTRRGAIAAIVLGIPGAILGSILIPVPIVGTLLGAAVGAAAGSMLGDLWARQSLPDAAKAAKGAAVGKLTGSIAKLAVASVMWVVVLVALLV